MTPRQLWFHAAVFAAALATLAGALATGLFVVPRLGWEAQHFAWAVLAWQSGLALVLLGVAFFQLGWGFLTARPMWLLIVSSALTLWLIPLAAWAFWLWSEERQYLDSEQARMRGGESERRNGDSASKDSPST